MNLETEIPFDDRRLNRLHECNGRVPLTGGATAEKFFVYDECGMVCNERIRLLDEYAAATSAYRTAFAKVRPAKEAGLGLTESLLASKEARETCAKARLALRHHKGEHGC